MIELYTIQISNIRAVEFKDIEVIDTTVKSGHGMLAPTWDMVWDSKSGELSWDEYTSRYLSMMRESLEANPQLWNRLFESRGMDPKRIALACYCKPGRPCHRHLLKEFVMDWRSSLGDEVIDMGEIT